ncbi:MAG: LD-carboxypeptidase, partial [Burkholderiales bacterium]
MTSLTLFTPSGVLAKAENLKRAAKRLTQLGFEVSVDSDALSRHQRFAGDDAARLAALHRIADAAPSVALATRGGYGLTRLLDQLDWGRIARSIEQGTRWVGYSDLTALQNGLIARHKGLSMWAGPLACDDFGRSDAEGGVDEVTRDCFTEAMSGALEAVGFREPTGGFDGLEARGRLWGGNLTVLCSLLGTPHWPKIKGGILFLEDINEHPYRVERMLLQLQQAGAIDA